MSDISTSPFVDPGEPGELKANLRASDLLNLPCLFRVTGEGVWEAKPEEHKREQPYVECDVAVLGSSGVENWASDVRISWTRVVPAQLSMAKKGQWVAARPRQQEDRSIILVGFDEKGKAAAATLLPEVERLFGANQGVGTPPVFEDGEEPF